MATALLHRPLTSAQRDVLARRLRQTRGLAAISVPLAPGVDPAAVAVASRQGDEPLFCFESEGSALAGLGCVHAVEETGRDRFTRAAVRWRKLASDAVCDAPEGPRGAGLIAVGGFAFADAGGQAAHWDGFAPASLHVPEVSIAAAGTDVRLTIAAWGGGDVDATLARLEARLASLVERPMPMLDPEPAGRTRVASVMPPEHFEDVIVRATDRIARGDFEKIVLAREVAVRTARDHDAAAVYDVLRGAFGSCYVFLVARGDAAFVAASPELLVRREGLRAQTVALAGSIRRSADPAVDDHLGEQLLRSAKDRSEHAIVARRISRTMRRRALWVAAPDEPVIVKVANIQHLATPIRAQLREPTGTLDLAASLHPTPAVGAEPASAAAVIPALEGLDRGWYAGAVGWTDSSEDGELCVALRCALLRGREARCYAGVGVVRESQPAEELAETEVKLGALLPVLAL
ncbi:MAG: isochorismate synthase [Solirubrobacteraceae bacterium]